MKRALTSIFVICVFVSCTDRSESQQSTLNSEKNAAKFSNGLAVDEVDNVVHKGESNSSDISPLIAWAETMTEPLSFDLIVIGNLSLPVGRSEYSKKVDFEPEEVLFGQLGEEQVNFYLPCVADDASPYCNAESGQYGPFSGGRVILAGRLLCGSSSLETNEEYLILEIFPLRENQYGVPSSGLWYSWSETSDIFKNRLATFSSDRIGWSRCNSTGKTGVNKSEVVEHVEVAEDVDVAEDVKGYSL